MIIRIVRGVYNRLKQGVRALFAFAIPLDEAAAREVLSPALFTLFGRMTRSERLHSIIVMKTLCAQGHTHPDLLTAALLHDVGKSRYGKMNLFGRTLAAIVLKLSARAYRHYRDATNLAPRGWQRPFVIATQHPVWSAEDMSAAGASERAMWLARYHASELDHPPQTEDEHLLTALQMADEEH